MINKHTGLASLWLTRLCCAITDEAVFQVAMRVGGVTGASADERARWWAGYTHDPDLFQRAAAITWRRFYVERTAPVCREWLH